jgi:NAD(P)-dependent dehydrogenase (short-subunit alcohol dehydrogenase family)
MERTGRPATGRSALVTGGSRGIGAACVRALAAGGWRVAFTFFSGRDEAEAVERSVREEEGVAYAVRANLGNEAHLEKVRETVESKLGSLHLFVSNAAGGFLKPGLETEPRRRSSSSRAGPRSVWRRTTRAPSETFPLRARSGSAARS